MRLRHSVWAWVAALLVVIGLCAFWIVVILKPGTDTDRAKANETVEAIAAESTLEVLPEVAPSGGEVLDQAKEGVEQLATEQIEDVSDETTGDLVEKTAVAVEAAAIGIRNAATENLEPTLEVEGLSDTSGIAMGLVDSTLAKLALTPDDLANTEELQLEISAAAELALDETVDELGGRDAQALQEASEEIEEATVNALTTAVDAGVSEAGQSATQELEDETKDDLGEEETGLLAGADDVGFLSIASGIGALALRELLALITSIVLGWRSSAAQGVGPGPSAAAPSPE